MFRKIRFAALLAAAVTVLALSPAALAESYWYEDYERTIEMIDDGKFAEAETELTALIAKHPHPKAKSRVPGERFVVYVPYFQMARVQAGLGQMEQAQTSLDISEAFAAWESDKKSTRAFRALRVDLQESLQLAAR